MNYGQFLPSLAIAKKIKESDPEKKIIFGGSRTVDTLGIKVLETFNYVDFIVSGDGEDALHHLASNYQNYESIPHLMYKVGKEVIWKCYNPNDDPQNCVGNEDFCEDADFTNPMIIWDDFTIEALTPYPPRMLYMSSNR